MREFVQQEAANRRLYLSAQQRSALVEASGGVPEVAWRDLSLMARSGRTVAEATAPDNQEPLARPLLGDVFAALRERLPGHRTDVLRILLALAFFDERVGVRADVIHRVADVDPDLCRRALHLLGVLNLIRVSDAPGYDDETPVGDSGPRYVTIPYVAEQAAAHLDVAMRHEVEMRARWVAYYVDFAEAHGRVRPTHSLDYDAIQREWPNLRKVFAWCATQPDAYERLKQFWLDDRVSTFADVRGYWEDRRRWLLRLAELAASRDDRGTAAVAAEATVQAAHSTVLLERYHEAAAELERARGWSEDAAPRLRGEISAAWAMLTVRQRDFVGACRWLTDLKRSLTHDTLDAVMRRHLEIELAYYQGRVFLLQGRSCDAEHAFQRMLALCEAQPGRWVRERAYALNALAEVALALGEPERAVPVLEAAFDVAADIKDRRLRASITRTRAALWRRQGQRQRARKLTNDAQNEFAELGMKQEAAETANCIKILAGV
jgi:LuxR family glucitol operon transcriptional activator